MAGTLHEDVCTFMIMCRSVLLRMRNVSDKSRIENQNTHFVSSNFFFLLENHAVCEIKWKNIVQPDRPQMTIWRMRIAYWIIKTTYTHSEYVMLNAFPLQHWLHERTSMLRSYVRYLYCYSIL
jgi:hypothetical protein